MSAIATQMRREWNGRRMWQIGFVVQSVAIVFLSVYYPWLNAQEQRVAIVHGGTHYVGGSLPLHSASETHKELAKIAAEVMINRNPNGFDNLEALQCIFNPPTQKEIIAHAALDQNMFREQSVTQNLQITRNIVEQANTSETVDMLVEGDVIRNKVIRGVTSVDSVPVSILLRLRRNEDWATNGKFMMTVILVQSNFL
jgi:hypothetical protein